MKKKLFSIAMCAFAAILLFSGCGETVTPPPPQSEIDNPNNPNRPDRPDQPNPDTPEPTEAEFSVTLEFPNGGFEIPEGFYAQWSDGYSIHRAAFNERGVATTSGLDGDYQVTLTELPAGFTYNPNIYVATNDRRDLVIPIYRIEPTTGTGKDKYENIIVVSSLSVYRATLTGPDDVVFFEYAPLESGTYSIESWMDITANTINPIMDFYNGTHAFKPDTPTTIQDGGGASASYTKNFLWKIEMDESNFSTSGGGQAVFAFGIRATAKEEAKFPVNIDFGIRRNGEFSFDRVDAKLMIPTENLHKIADEEGTLTSMASVINGRRVFDDSICRLNPDDGYYHLYDTEKYAETDGYGPLVYAHITSNCDFLDDAFILIESHGNKALTVSNGTENYKYFIEQCYGAMGDDGKPLYCNSDGMYPVTQELKEFLLKYAINQQLFFDGNGWAETVISPRHDALDGSDWLFACKYYAK